MIIYMHLLQNLHFCVRLVFFLKRAIRAVVHTFKTIRNVSITGHKDRKFSMLTLI